jgi:hypothetical protein
MNRKPYRRESLVLLLLLVAICTSIAHGQSGRRQPKPPPAAPIPTPTPEPTPEPKPPQKEPDFGFLLGSDHFGYDSFPLGYYDAVMRGCGDRLRYGSSARVDVTQNSMSRGEAIKKAKAETTTYVVLLRLLLDQMTAQSYDDLEVDFVVFAPQTAKVVTSGKAYLGGVRKGGVVVGPTTRGPTGPLYREQMLKRAGEEVGERILKAMNLNVPEIR